MPPTYEFHVGDTSNDRNTIVSPDWNMMMEIQTFTPSYKFYEKNNAIIIGNAVPPKNVSSFSKYYFDALSFNKDLRRVFSISK